MKWLALIVLVLLVAGCSGQRSNRENFVYDDFGNDIENEQKCFELCKNREQKCESNVGIIGGGLRTCTGVPGYRCDYDPPVCDGEKCLCKTW